MDNQNLFIETAEVRVYDSPLCEEILLGPQKVICASDTEVVGEDEGEW